MRPEDLPPTPGGQPDLERRMLSVMAGLTNRNRALGGRLFVETIGARAFVFPTPISTILNSADETSKSAYLFLVITTKGFRFIEIPDDERGFISGRKARDMIADELTINLRDQSRASGPSTVEYTSWGDIVSKISDELKIDYWEIQAASATLGRNTRSPVRLVSAVDQNQIRKILLSNIERAEREYEEAERLRIEAEKGRQDQLDAAKGLEELLS